MLQCQPVIRSFRHKGLREFYAVGQSRRILRIQNSRILILLDFLDSATRPEEMNLPGFHFHKLHGSEERYSVRVSANWRLTFGWDDSDATHVDLEDYH
jgi:proteic killer suppression protein